MARLAPPGCTVSGGNILSMLSAMGPFRKRGEQILEEHRITDVEADAWLPLDAYVRSLEAIHSKMGPNTLYQVGRQIPNHVPLPPGIDTFEKVLASFGMAFDMNHRGMQGVITYTMQGDRNATIVTGTPYPCDFDRGVISGFFHKLLSTRIVLEKDTTVSCKALDGDTCTYVVRLPLA